MIKLPKTLYGTALERYRQAGEFFPLIGAVLLDAQNGVAYADDARTPLQFYVEHSFGFAQIFGRSSNAFEEALESHLFVTKAFSAPKVRLYGIDAPDFLSKPEYRSFRSVRQRFCHEISVANDEHEASCVDETGVEEVERTFGVVTRFWRTARDFLNHAHACVVRHEGALASICYAAAVADAKAEIDVITVESRRRTGAGKAAVRAFIERCSAERIEPLWDCFANNEGSMALARATGFRPSRSGYPFFTMSR